MVLACLDRPDFLSNGAGMVKLICMTKEQMSESPAGVLGASVTVPTQEDEEAKENQKEVRTLPLF